MAKFHHSKLNFKDSDGGAEVKWHQDIQFWPHTNYSPLTVGTYLCDCGPEQGPLGVIPGSHEDELFDLYNEAEKWTGHIAARDLERVAIDKADYLCGQAGSITIHNCRSVHGSRPDNSPQSRPLFLLTFPRRTRSPTPTTRCARLIPAQSCVASRRAGHISTRAPASCRRTGRAGYSSIFALQQGEGAGGSTARPARAAE